MSEEQFTAFSILLAAVSLPSVSLLFAGAWELWSYATKSKGARLMSKQYHIIRGRDSGVFFACDIELEGTQAAMGWSRMIHYWEGAAALSQVSVDGIRSGRVCVPVEGRIVLDVCEIISCTDAAAENLLAQKEWTA
jgi:hypothetical protein